MIENEKKTNFAEEPRVMSTHDVKDYEGITLNEQGEEDYQAEGTWENSHAQVRVIRINDLPLWKKVLYGIVAIGVLIALEIFAWFAFLWFGVIAVVGSILYFLRRLL